MDTDAVRRFFATVVAPAWGSRVDERMKSLRMNNAQLAALAGTTPQTIHKLRTGEIVPRDYLRYSTAASLGTTVSDLYPLPDMTTVQAAA